jgi:hypothetical protein
MMDEEIMGVLTSKNSRKEVLFSQFIITVAAQRQIYTGLSP